MRELGVDKITAAVERLCVEANRFLPPEAERALRAAAESEPWPPAREILRDLERNLDAARSTPLPICQDTGLVTVYLELGQDVHLTGGDLDEAVQEGVRRGYEAGHLRKSVVRDPLRRVNTGDNTPAVLHTRIVPGDRVHIVAAPKGFGSENMSQLRMFTPSAAPQDLMDFVVQVVRDAGGNPCPPMVVGVGFGGDFEQCAFLAKKALCRACSERNPDPYYADMEAQLLARINALGIGPQGFGGKTTALYVNIETAPTHIAGLPVAVNIGCHVTRHAEATL